MDEERDQMPGERSARVQHRDGVVRLYQRCEYPMPILDRPSNLVQPMLNYNTDISVILAKSAYASLY